MKKIALISAIAVSGLFYSTANAQIRIGLGLHINTPVRVVTEAPVYTNYNGSDDYYYLPDVDAYYCVAEQSYYYNDGNRWISTVYLPGEYRNYNWRNVRRYEVRASRPYLNADMYRERYRGNVGNWGRYGNYDNRNERNYYGNHDFNRGGQRNNDLRFERRGDMNRGEEHADNRGGYYGQSNRGQGYYGQPRHEGRSQGWNGQQYRQNGNDQQRGNGGEQHFTGNHDRGEHERSGF
ncbi:hypothetical protein [Mucilaginibacter sp.]|uniref:hypothetical protein n=1 Tax=Mucilaginibacter sp. TaxID=1882438 RepID=UPI0026378482|nr:hypothetical protein [Mucilaginibacter sp.]MDB4927413.1 hypothetical protein [Mucilaginibacter sp.]